MAYGVPSRCPDCDLEHRTFHFTDCETAVLLAFHLGVRYTARLLWGVLTDRLWYRPQVAFSRRLLGRLGVSPDSGKA